MAQSETSRTITDPQTMRALAHPARLEIIKHLSTTGAVVTATEMAARVGLSPSATSYHLRELAKYGLSSWRRAGATPGNGSGAVQGAGMAGLLVGGLLVDAFDRRLLVAAAGAADLVAVLGCVPVVRRAVRREQHPGILPAGAGEPGIASMHERQHPAPSGRPHPVPELPADLLGPDAVRRAA